MSLLKRTTYQPQEVETITEPKEGFAMVDFKDIDTVIENLTAAEMKLWLYLQKLDRYGEKFKDLPTPKELAIRLGLSKRTVEKAMFRLNELGLYVIRIKQWEGVNSSAARAHQTAKKMKAAKKDKETLEPLQTERGYLTANAVNLPNSGYLAANAVNLPNERLFSRDQPPEPLLQEDSKTPQTIKTYSDFIRSLSEEEREKFLKFGEKQALELPNPPKLTDKWIAKNFKELYKKFKASETTSAAARAPKKEWKYEDDWTQHPQYEEWLVAAYKGGWDWVREVTRSEGKRERGLFLQWCEEHKAFSVFEEDRT